MNHVAATRSVHRVDPSVALTATHSVEIDTLGYNHASIDVLFSPFTSAAGPTTAATVLRVAHSDVAGSGQTNISGFVAGTDFTVAAGSTAGNVGYAHRFDIDLKGKRRYLTVYATPASTCGVVTTCRLSQGEEGPTTAAGRGVNTQAVG